MSKGRIGQLFLPLYSKRQIILPKITRYEYFWYMMPMLETATQEEILPLVLSERSFG